MQFDQNIITDEEIEDLEELQLIKMKEEDFQYSFNSDEDINKGNGYQVEEINIRDLSQ